MHYYNEELEHIANCIEIYEDYLAYKNNKNIITLREFDHSLLSTVNHPKARLLNRKFNIYQYKILENYYNKFLSDTKPADIIMDLFVTPAGKIIRELIGNPMSLLTINNLDVEDQEKIDYYTNILRDYVVKHNVKEML